MESFFSGNETSKLSVSHHENDSRVIVAENDSSEEEICKMNLKYSTLKLVLIEQTSSVKLLSKQRLKKNEDVLIIRVIYQSKVTDAVVTWEIHKTIAKIKDLQGYVKQHWEQNKDIGDIANKFISVKLEDMKDTSTAVIDILNNLLTYQQFKVDVIIREFLEISSHSFQSLSDGNKPKEGYILKRVDPSICMRIFSCLFCCCVKMWNKRWFVLKDDMICYLDSSVTNIGKDIFWFDQEIRIERDYNNIHNTIGLINVSRKLILKFTDEFEREIWYEMISQKISEYQCCVKNRYRSFVNEKEQCNAKWLVDGCSYFSDLFVRLMGAKETIFIAGWWISPELFLQRPVCMDDYKKDNLKIPQLNRLMDILKHKADNGVQIYILVFNEMSLALPNNSSHTKESFIHKNIKVTRHPRTNLDMWSNHEKIVIIDQKYGYLGGIDLCWGRYDTPDHRLAEEANGSNIYYWPGIDYSNVRIKEFDNVRNYLAERLDRCQQVRMPWHDVHVLLEGPVVSDLSRHFVERWNFAKSIDHGKGNTITNVRTMSGSLGKATPVDETITSKFKNNPDMDSVFLAPLIEEIVPLDFSSENNYPTYKNEIDEEKNEFSLKKVRSLEDYPQSYQNSPLYFTEGYQNEEQSWRNRNPTCFQQSMKIMNNDAPKTVMDQIKGTFQNMTESSSYITKKIYKKMFSSRRSTETSNGSLLNLNINDRKLIAHENKMKCQILRSASLWSAGLDKKTESSILNAYYDLIENSKHYIYIENQFFISKSYTDEEYVSSRQPMSSFIENQIALKIRQRIERAYREKTKFRVFIFIPLLPGFPGEVNDSSTLQVILKYTYRTISRNRGLSLIEKLYQLMNEKVEDYIYFFSLRTHSIVKDIPSTELIYIHSKLMIVDDQICLIGSANINDRSLLGSRDSDIAVIIKEKELIESTMNGQPYTASNFARSLRIRLLREHMGFVHDNGVIPDILKDPLNDDLFTQMKSISRSNTLLYREIFNCIPDDRIEKFSAIDFTKKHKLDEVKKLYESKKHNIIGYIVDFPLEFLKEEYLQRSCFSKEIFVPIKNFV